MAQRGQQVAVETAEGNTSAVIIVATVVRGGGVARTGGAIGSHWPVTRRNHMQTQTVEKGGQS